MASPVLVLCHVLCWEGFVYYVSTFKDSILIIHTGRGTQKLCALGCGQDALSPREHAPFIKYAILNLEEIFHSYHVGTCDLCIV